MSRFQHSHDDVLNAEERGESARKCLSLLESKREAMSEKDLSFFDKEFGKRNYINYSVSQPQLNWLRDMVERYP